MLSVEQATGLVTVQDDGWPIGRAMGLPQCGAIDPPALWIGNALVGNPTGAAGLEVSGKLAARFTEAVRFAVTGAGAAELDGRDVPGWTTLVAETGSRLTVRSGPIGRFGYLAVAGGIEVAPVLGARCTYLPTGIGGFEGRRLKPGDHLAIGAPGRGPPPGTAVEPGIVEGAGRIRLVRGPQAHLFAEDSHGLLVGTDYTISNLSDRMGSRLAGPPLRPLRPATLLSEAACPGAVQVPDDGQPIVILADGPTVGGYPKIAVVISADLARFGQVGPGAAVQFEAVSLAEAGRIRAEWSNRLGRVVAALRGGSR